MQYKEKIMGELRECPNLPLLSLLIRTHRILSAVNAETIDGAYHGILIDGIVAWVIETWTDQHIGHRVRFPFKLRISIHAAVAWETVVLALTESTTLCSKILAWRFWPHTKEKKLKRSSCWPELTKVNLKTELYGTGGEYLWGLTMVLTMVLHRQ